MIVSLTECFDNLQTMFDLKYYNEVCGLINAMNQVINLHQKCKESLRSSVFGTGFFTYYRDAIRREDEFNTRYDALLNCHKHYVKWYFNK